MNTVWVVIVSVVIGFVMWSVIALWVGVVLGRMLADRDRQVPPSDEDES